jgi:ornithine cyclodeaminase
MSDTIGPALVAGPDEIRSAVDRVDVVGLVERGFVAYSRGEVVVPPVGELLFEQPPGECHIKYGYIRGDDLYVIKVASGFYENPHLGLPSSQGLMLLFCSRTGVPKAVLLDNGYLTDVRTAAAGAVAARHLAPREVNRIGIVGAGTQGRLQLRYLREVTSCRNALVWSPDPGEFPGYRSSFEESDLRVETTSDLAGLAAKCNLIVTATPSTTPLLQAEWIRPGTHITAVGSDTAHKIELDPAILGMADLVVADSLVQSESRGEIFRAVQAGTISRAGVAELGNVIAAPDRARSDDSQITVCDLTGVAVQDIQIAKAVYSGIAGED